MESLLIQKLREALANTTKEEFQREWEAIQAMGLKGPTVSEFLANKRMARVYQSDDTVEMNDILTQKSMYLVESEQTTHLALAA